MADVIDFISKKTIEQDDSEEAFKEFTQCLLKVNHYNNRAEELAHKYGFEILYDTEFELED